VLSVLGVEELTTDKLTEDRLYKDNESIINSESSFVLSSYAYESLLACPYRFYLEYILKLNKHSREVKYKMDSRIIGIVVHEVLERLGNEKRREIIEGDYFVSQERIKTILKNVLREKQDYIPKNYENYYEKIMFPIFIRGMEAFYEKLYAKVGEIKLTSFAQEKSKKEKLFSKGYINVELSGRGDLVLEGEGVKALFDYKTGNGSFKQLYFYSILYYESEEVTEKYIYNVWDSVLLEDDKKNIITRDDMVDSISNFIEDEIFRRTERKENCRSCIYKDICRMRWECE
jgi:ATP-dependent helicase/DNAse subunit B